MWFQQIILVMFTCSFVFGEESFNHDFGDNFKDVFSSGTGICGSLRPWIQANYNTTNVDAPNPDSPQFVKPDTTFSCIFSDDFSMSNEGQLQLNVYLNFTSLLDQISVVAYKSENNVIVGEIISSLDHSHNNSDWNTLSITITDNETDGPFDGFVAIVGRASSNSYILVDHIQYLPPGDDCDDDNCESEQAPCIYFDFSDIEFFYQQFTASNSICANITETWKWQYISNETYGIAPTGVNSISCISSPYVTFNKGSLNVTLLIKSDSYFDLISVLLNNRQEVFQSKVYGKLTNENITSESETLEIPVDYEGEAQITFIGLATQEATVLVESFKYTPSNWDSNCIKIEETRHVVDSYQIK